MVFASAVEGINHHGCGRPSGENKQQNSGVLLSTTTYMHTYMYCTCRQMMESVRNELQVAHAQRWRYWLGSVERLPQALQVISSIGAYYADDVFEKRLGMNDHLLLQTRNSD